MPGGCQGDAPGGCQGDARGVPKGCRRGARRGARLEPAAVRCACRRRGACPSRCAGCAACRRSAGGASTARRACRAGPHLPCATHTVRAVRAALRLWCKRGRRASGQAALVRAWWPERLRRRATRRATRSAWAASGQAALRLGCAQHAGGAGTVAPGRTCQLRRSPVSIMASVSGLRPTLWQHAPICCCTSGRVGAMKTTVPVGNQRRKLCMTTEAISVLPAVQHTVRATHGTPEAGTRTACVQCVGGRGQAAQCLRYVEHAGGGYA